MKIGMTSIFVHNPNAAFKFYTEVLGFVEKMYMPQYNLAIVVSAEDTDGTNLLLSPVDSPWGKQFQMGLYSAGIPAIVFMTADVRAEYEKLTAKGVSFSHEPVETEWGIQAIFDDTCGNMIQLHQV